MSPIEHYRRAEGLLKTLNDASQDWYYQHAPLVLAEAQVHATLAACHMTAGAWAEEER